MSVCRKLPDGTIQKIAGHTILLDANASEIRKGTFSISGNGWHDTDITFTDPMPDTDYIVIPTVIQQGSESDIATQWTITNKATTGCTISYFSNLGSTKQCEYVAFKLIPLDGYTALQNKVNNPDEVPTENSENLVKSGGVYEAIKNASSVFVGTRAEWTAATQTDYDIAVITDEHKILSIDKTAGTTAEQANLNKIWEGTQAEWDALTDEQRNYYDHAMIKNKSVATNILEKIYSVGALYFNTADVDPAEIFGFGTWERVAKNMTLWGASADGQGGTTKAAGLPNITGTFHIGTGLVTSQQDRTQTHGYAGAFTGVNANTATREISTQMIGTDTLLGRQVEFNASQSNPIYGASTTVQPPAFVVNIWRRTA